MRTHPSLRGLSIWFAIAMLLATTSHAFAHAHLDSSDPAADAALDTAPAAVTIWFTEELQTQDSWIHVLSEDGQRVDMNDSQLLPDNEAALMVSLRPGLAPGTYTVSWQNLSQDGDGLSGSFHFGVGIAPTIMGASEDEMDDDH